MPKNTLKAYEDIDFLKSEACRPIRLQLELLKPETVFRENNIISTMVLFGSARTVSPEVAKKELAEAKKTLKKDAENKNYISMLKLAEKKLKDSKYYQLARDFAALVSSKCQTNHLRELVVITGGGGGIMEAGNRGANDVGAKSIGLNISLPFEQHENPYISDDLSFNFHYFSIRKMHFLLRAKAVSAFPGGFGTMDELFEAVTLIQTKKMPRIPIILFGKDFWEDVINWDAFIEHAVISPKDLDLINYCDTPEEGWEVIANFWNFKDI